MTVPEFHLETHIPEGGPILRDRAPAPCAIVIFGATGDLAHRKLIPALYNLERDGSLPEGLMIYGYARREKTRDGYLKELRRSADEHSRTKPLDDEVWNRFTNRIDYLQGGFDEPGGYNALRVRLEQDADRCGTGGNWLHYLSTPPDQFAVVLRQLAGAGLIHPYSPMPGDPWTRVVVEKPFGRDLSSARDLNREIAEILDERQTYRIDHYLGKETVQNILVFRFGNAIFEHLWNRKYIDHVEITMAEEIGVEGRGAFYDQAGVLRDVVQNHVLQLLSLCAMEPPVSFQADDIRDQKLAVLRSLRPISDPEALAEIVRGQYEGYRREDGVGADSETPTYTAMKVMIDNWRWQGVPFYLRAGKRLARRKTKIAVVFQDVPLCLFGNDEVCQRIEPNILILRIQPNEGITLRFATKVPGVDLSIGDVTMDFKYASAFRMQPQEAYERLLLDAMRGDQTLFERWDALERAWAFVTPILEAWEKDPASVSIYPSGSSGPREADALIRRDGRTWRPL